VLGELVEKLGRDQVDLPQVGTLGVPPAVEPVADRRTAVCVALDAEVLEQPHLARG
jgi:hypothetical protein